MSRFQAVLFTICLLLSSTNFANGGGSHGKSGPVSTAKAPPTQPLRVHIGARLIKIFYAEPPSTESPQLKARFRLRIEWRDERLAEWQEDDLHTHEYQDDEAAEKLSTIFNPGIEVANGTFETEHLHLRIYRHGAVALTHVMDVTVPANMLLTHFPFDSQIFAFRFASAYWNENEVDLKLNSIESGMEVDKEAPKTWHFGFNSHYVSVTRLGAHEEEHAVMNFFLHAQREPDYFIWRLLIPLLAMVFLSWNVFWMFEDASSAFSNCIVFLHKGSPTLKENSRSCVPVNCHRKRHRQVNNSKLMWRT